MFSPALPVIRMDQAFHPCQKAHLNQGNQPFLEIPGVQAPPAEKEAGESMRGDRGMFQVKWYSSTWSFSATLGLSNKICV